MNRTAVYALTHKGAHIGKLLADRLEGDLFLPYELATAIGGKPFHRLKDLVAETFTLYRRHIFVTAVAIAVRAIAPHLRSKAKDPAVIALDQRGRHVVSVLSGHLGGANRLTEEIAELIGGIPVITTATDTEGLPSIDLLALEKGLAIENPDAIKSVNKAFLKGDPVQVYDPEDRLGLSHSAGHNVQVRPVKSEREWAASVPGVCVTWKIVKQNPKRLLLRPAVLVAGIGCNRGVMAKEILDLIHDTLLAHSLSRLSLRCMATIEKKRDEKGLTEAAKDLNVPLLFFDSKRLATVEVPNPSSTVRRHMGVSSVCEAAALLKTGAKELLVPKTKSRNATLAIALQD